MFIPSHRLIVSPGKERVEQWDSVVPALEKQTPAASAYHAVLSERAIKWLRVSTRGDTFTSTTKAIDIRRPAILDEHFDGRERMRRPQRSNLWLATRIPHVLTTLLPPRGGFHVRVANGLPPRGIAVLLFFPILPSPDTSPAVTRCDSHKPWRQVSAWRRVVHGGYRAGIAGDHPGDRTHSDLVIRFHKAVPALGRGPWPGITNLVPATLPGQSRTGSWPTRLRSACLRLVIYYALFFATTVST